jgi:hypothetical protein
MSRQTSYSRVLPLGAALLLATLAAGCAGNRDPILGLGGDTVLLIAPTVTAVAPVNNASGVPTNNTLITAAFSEPMLPITGSASFAVTSASSTPAGTVTLDPTGTIATFTLAPATSLAADTLYTATITGATGTNGLALANPFAWHFTTGASLGTTRPMVALTVPATTVPGPTLGVPTNTAITAVFTQDMNPLTLTAASFTLTPPAPGAAPQGQVSYVVGSRTAVFTPKAALAASTTYTATITSAASDLAGIALAGNQAPLPGASNYVWTFTTGTAPDSTSPTIILTAPASAASGVALNSAVNATFSKAMNPLTITTAHFKVRSSAPLGPVLAGTVFYDGTTGIATFTPAAAFTAATSYTATVSGVTDLAGNTLVAGPVPNPWTFTTGSELAPGPVALGSAANYGLMATATITNTGSSTVNGDVTLDPGTTLTGSPLVNGTVDVNDPASALARTDLAAAFNAANSLPAGTATGSTDLGAQYPLGIPPGIYTSAGAMLVSTPLTLNAGGDGNAVWVFQIGTSLTTTASVLLGDGAQAKNVFWVPGQAATLGAGTTFNGTIMAGVDITGGAGAVVYGRLLAGADSVNATVALQTDTISVPAQ